MSTIIEKFTKNYQIISATCKVLVDIDWFGNYKINSISNKDIQYIGQAKNIEQYVKRFIEIVKDNVLKNVSDINSIKWHIKGFDETISLHMFVREVGKILEKFIKSYLKKIYPYYAYHIDNHNTNFDKTIVIEITNNDKRIFIANITVEPFI